MMHLSLLVKLNQQDIIILYKYACKEVKIHVYMRTAL